MVNVGLFGLNDLTVGCPVMPPAFSHTVHGGSTAPPNVYRAQLRGGQPIWAPHRASARSALSRRCPGLPDRPPWDGALRDHRRGLLRRTLAPSSDSVGHPPTASSTNTPPPGCTPGYWKQPQNFDSYTPHIVSALLNSAAILIHHTCGRKTLSRRSVQDLAQLQQRDRDIENARVS